jgi:hypothetical protein
MWTDLVQDCQVTSLASSVIGSVEALGSTRESVNEINIFMYFLW